MKFRSGLSLLLIISHRLTSGTPVILNESIGVTNVQSQHVYLFDTDRCTGAPLEFTKSSSLSGVRKLSAFVIGMWHVKISDVDTSEITEEFIVAPGTTTCKSFSTQDVANLQLIRYGHENTSVPELKVFSKTFFVGDSSTILADGDADIPVTAGMSYVFSGPLNWALYSEPNFSGNVTYIVPTKETISKGYGISYAIYAKTPLMFRSAKAGACEGDGEIITTTTTTTTSTSSDPSDETTFSTTPPSSGGSENQAIAYLSLLIGISFSYLGINMN